MHNKTQTTLKGVKKELLCSTKQSNRSVGLFTMSSILRSNLQKDE